ncbi:MAG: flagellar basal body rod protein FlgC [Nitrospiraceae bacterium]|nr:flagellar basal body rod protein FlgC [Nitrospiraceae bacterium]
MDSFGILEVSASALSAQRQRMDAIASNMANARSTKSEEGGPYKKREVVFSTMPIESGPDGSLEGVQVSDVVKENAFQSVYDPGNPDADKKGFVTMPDINVVEEMVNMMTAYRAYEASVSTFNVSKAMLNKALVLGGQ